MKQIRPLVALCAAGAILAGCTTPSYYSPVEVTRFLDPSVAEVPRGPIGVRSSLEQDATDPLYAAFDAAIKQELDEIGFQVAGDVAPYTAVIDVEQWLVDARGRRSPATVGAGMGTGTYGSGAGVSLGLDLSGRDPDRIDTELTVRIRNTASNEAIWEGRALFSASDNSEFANLDAAARRMADALFAGFPGNSGETIEVE